NGGGPWYYAAGNEQKGPFSWDQMGALIQGGTIGPDTLVWSPSLSSWTPAAQTALASLASAPQPAPSPMTGSTPIARGTPPFPPPPAGAIGFPPPGFGPGSGYTQERRVTGFGEAIAVCFRKYVTFSGRASRPEFWFFYLFTIIVSVAATAA